MNCRLRQWRHRGVVSGPGCRHVQAEATGSPNPYRGEGWNYQARIRAQKAPIVHRWAPVAITADPKGLLTARHGMASGGSSGWRSA